MTKQNLIENTTREQRVQIVRMALGLNESDSSNSCDEMIGEDNAFDMYLPYIEGELEIDEINRACRTRWMKDMEGVERSGCGL